ncbi:hypothetical protein [Deinococcus hopiensis]|uniref:Helix-turn-helix domain-containing protein n=1 Tax=Deinococcus hopiensis KR-140 TaxID=695939 RepID=A0A1W1V6W7_9DEIO|nr:hypothetical protein [Deinococcus hopiensis]SMB89148.1 hypothetical protein SAMN00790413_00286 [Deinococcus hopiensis KR-140]
MNAAVIKFPAPAQQQQKRREAGTFTTTDSAVVEFQKKNGSAASRTLTALAERSNYTHKPPMSVAELQQETDLGQRAVEKALAALSSQGFCAQVGKLWKYTNPNADANGNANSRSHERSQNEQENIVLDREKEPLKEVEGSRRIMNNNTPEKEPSYGDALRAVDGAGLLELWRNWVALQGIRKPTQDTQIKTWAAWVEEGRADALRAAAQNIIGMGSYAHPFSALKKHMTAGAGNVNAPGTETGSGPARPALSVGQFVRHSDGVEAQIVHVGSRCVTTTHPDFPDVPLAQVKTLTVLE